MRHFSIFYILFFQIILFARPIVSQLDQERIRKAFADAGLIPNEAQGVFNFGYNVAQPVKRCSTIKYPLDPVTFLIDICFDEPSKGLEAKLKVGDVDLGQAKGTFEGGVLISFEHGKCLNGHHRYYVKENELWLRYSNTMFGKDDNGDLKLRSLSFISSEGLDVPKPKKDVPSPEPKKDAASPEPKKDTPSSEPKKDTPSPELQKDAPSPEPKKDAPSPEPKKDAPSPEPKKDAPSPKPKKDAPKPGPKKNAPKPGPKKDAPKRKPKGNAKPEPKKDTPKPKPIPASL